VRRDTGVDRTSPGCRLSSVKEPPLVRIELSSMKSEFTIMKPVGLAKFGFSLGWSVLPSLTPTKLVLRGSLDVVGSSV
jgi:hypothetical protein